jgi:hypothetical protein
LTVYAQQVKIVTASHADDIETATNRALAAIAREGHPVVSVTVAENGGPETTWYVATIVYNGTIADSEEQRP